MRVGTVIASVVGLAGLFSVQLPVENLFPSREKTPEAVVGSLAPTDTNLRLSETDIRDIVAQQVAQSIAEAQPDEPETDQAPDPPSLDGGRVDEPVVKQAVPKKPAIETEIRRWTSPELKVAIRNIRPGRYTGSEFADISPKTRSWALTHLIQDHGFYPSQLTALSDNELFHLHDLRHGGKLTPFCRAVVSSKSQDPVLNVQRAPADKPFIRMLTLSGCPPCKWWKDTQKPKIPQDWGFKEDTATTGSVPRFEVTYRGRTSYFQGPVTFEQIERTVLGTNQNTTPRAALPWRR